MNNAMSVTLDAWKRKLLDLTRRNKALSFRSTKASTVEVVDEKPAEVFDSLYGGAKSMSFRATDDDSLFGPESSSETSTDRIEQLLMDNDELLTSESTRRAEVFEPYEKAELHARHTDSVLQTTHTAVVLDRNLRRLSELSRLSIEEQGLNTLFLSLGMLHYYESSDSSELMRAPVFLLPVSLVRKNARSGYSIQWNEDEPLVNPTLTEYLRRSFGIHMPAFKDTLDSEDLDLKGFLAALASQIEKRSRWKLCDEIYLAQFSFQKLVLYNDLDKNATSIASHRVVRSIVSKSSDYSGDLPGDVKQLSLDKQFPPEKTHQVVDADSSQQRALAAIASEHDLVLIGPPGTGKSQTITNIIAHAVATGRSVLFVAEKMAALEVVHRRLDAVGLGEFCLELHSTKSNKRHVMREIGKTLDASLNRAEVPRNSTDRLPHFRHTLNEYALALHSPYGSLGISPFQAFGELVRFERYPLVRFNRPISDTDQAVLAQTFEHLRELSVAQSAVGNPASQPWRGARRTYYSASDLEDIAELTSACLGEIASLLTDSSSATRELGLPQLTSLHDVESLVEVAEILGKSPSAAEDILKSDLWNSPPAESTELISEIQRIQAVERVVMGIFESTILDSLSWEDLSHFRGKLSGRVGFLAFLDSRFRAIRRSWRSQLLPIVKRSSRDLLRDAEQVFELQSMLASLESRRDEATKLFGVHWKGAQSSVEGLKSFAHWVVGFRKAFIQHHLGDAAIQAASHAAPQISIAFRIKEAAGRLSGQLERLSQCLEMPSENLTCLELLDLQQRLQAINSDPRAGVRWAAFESARQKVESGIASEFLDHAFNGRVKWEEMLESFARAFYQKWLDLALSEREPLKAFSSLSHEERIREFRKLDQRVLAENQTLIIEKLRGETQTRLRDPELVPALSILRRELARQRGHRPLRETMKGAAPAIRAIKPCLLMSPNTVAQFLDGSMPSFDLVIFDEASQMPTEEAIGSIVRGRQIVVVGDPNQLPPTNFFSIMGGQIEPILGDDGQPIFDDSESILEEIQAAGFPKCYLTWHYRSLFESLIEFSNRTFYESRLMTFPSPIIEGETRGIRFEYVVDGKYEGNGRNRSEARRVVDAVVEHALQNPKLSLGVGTFSLRQQIEIGDELELRRRQLPEIEPFLAGANGEPFFIKNLETIQGDERDVIFLSITYGKTEDGKLRYNFGPLNSQNGWRRLNVLVSRARQKMVVFSSIKGDDISVSTDSVGALLLRDFLIYAERGKFDGTRITSGAAAESPFERSVFEELTRRGLILDAQVGVAGYRIDFGVKDPKSVGRYICGIECDGAAYHSSETARDRDRLRHQVLTQRGWTLHRIWSTDWFKDKDAQVTRILRLVNETRSRLVEQGSPSALRESEFLATPATKTPSSNSIIKRDPKLDPPEFSRPTQELYETARIPAPKTSDILEADSRELFTAVTEVVRTEAPVHIDDLLTRVAGMWGNRAGSRISDRIMYICSLAQSRGELQLRDGFVYQPGAQIKARSRARTGIPAERIAPEEYRVAVLVILHGGVSLSHDDLVTEVRTLLGFQRTGHHLESRINSAISELVNAGDIGESSGGFSTVRRF